MSNYFVSALFAIAVFVAGCTKKGTGSLDYGLDVKDTLRINLQTEPPTLDWHKSVDTTSSKIQHNIMESLVNFDLNDPELSLTPGLATKWAPSNGARTWTVTLRQGVKWTDGVLFKGQDVVDGWERLLNPQTAAQYAYFMYPVKNAKAYNMGKLKDFSKVGIKLDKDQNLVIELEQPMGFFPMLLTHIAAMPIRKDLIQKFGEKWTDPENIQTLGPYKLKIWEHDKAIVLDRYDGYFGDRAKTGHILGYMIAELSTVLSLMEAGRLDFQEELPAKELPILRKTPGYNTQEELSTYYYGFNTKKAPFNDVRVRRAFVAAVDRKQVTDLLGTGATPLTSWIPKGMFGYEPDRGQKYDPVLAAKLLDDAGYKDRSKLPAVTLAFNTNENHQRIAENVQAQLKKNLGIQVQLGNEEWKTYLSHLNTDPPQMFRMGWLADYPDPSTYTDQLISGAENNHTGWTNQKYDALNFEAMRSLDKNKRRVIYAELQKILVEDFVPVLPIYSATRPILVNPRVKNFPLSPLSRYEFKRVTLQ